MYVKGNKELNVTVTYTQSIQLGIITITDNDTVIWKWMTNYDGYEPYHSVLWQAELCYFLKGYVL